MDKKLPIVFTGGGTGGHLTPLISVIRELKKNPASERLSFFYLGPKNKLASDLFLPEQVVIKNITDGKIRRYFSWQNIMDIIFGIPMGFLQSVFYLLLIRPRLVFSKGGSGSYVVCLAARLLDIPVFIHESDSVPGLSNKKVSVWARKIFTSFEKTEYLNEKGGLVVGNPVRHELLNADLVEAKKAFRIDSAKPVIFFFGGSLGSEAINEFAVSLLEDLLPHYEIIHMCGLKNYKKTHAEAMAVLQFIPHLKPCYHLYDLLNEVELKNAYGASDIIVARAGSASIFEIALLGKPSILIPLPSAAGDHQSKNAYQYSETKAGVTLEQSNLTPHLFIETINQLLARRQQIQLLAKTFAKPNAAKKIAQEILDFLQNHEN